MSIYTKCIHKNPKIEVDKSNNSYWKIFAKQEINHGELLLCEHLIVSKKY